MLKSLSKLFLFCCHCQELDFNLLWYCTMISVYVLRMIEFRNMPILFSNDYLVSGPALFYAVIIEQVDNIGWNYAYLFEYKHIFCRVDWKLQTLDGLCSRRTRDTPCVELWITWPQNWWRIKLMTTQLITGLWAFFAMSFSLAFHPLRPKVKKIHLKGMKRESCLSAFINMFWTISG